LTGPPSTIRPAPLPEQVAPDAAAAGHATSAHRAVFTRMARNIGWLLGGRGFTGAASLAYLALAARALGPQGFGTFSLILAYGAGIANLIQFRSWQAVIRFGAIHHGAERRDQLHRLFGFTATLDWTSALLGAVVAVFGTALAAPLLGWSSIEARDAALFGAVLLLSTGATPAGILRLGDRFDLLTYTEAIGPLIRLVGALAAWTAGLGINVFLMIWATAAIAQMLVGWAAALIIHRARLTLGRTAFRQTLAENPRLWRFMVQTNLSSSLSAIWQQLGVLAVGAVDGAVSAGAFRIASKLASSFSKPLETMTRVLYPELARLVASNDHATLRRVFLQLTAVSTVMAALVIGLAVFAGPRLLVLFSGHGFEGAYPYLIVLTIAAAIDLAGFGLESIHNAHGRSGRVLGARLIGAVTYVFALALLLPTIGPIGAAFAVVATSLAMRLHMAMSAKRILQRKGGEMEES